QDPAEDDAVVVGVDEADLAGHEEVVDEVVGAQGVGVHRGDLGGVGGVTLFHRVLLLVGIVEVRTVRTCSAHEPAPVDGDDGAVHVGGRVGGQEDERPREVVRGAPAGGGDALGDGPLARL